MTTTAAAVEQPRSHASAVHAKLAGGPGKLGMAVFGIALTVGLGYAGSQLLTDLADIHPSSAAGKSPG